MKFPFTNNVKSPEIIYLNQFELPIYIYREKRRNSRVSILKEKINVRLPIFLSNNQQKEEIDRLLKWASKRIEENKLKVKDIKQINYWKDRFIKFYDGKWLIDYFQINNSKSILLNINKNNRKLTFKGDFIGKNEEVINQYSGELIKQFTKKYYKIKIYNRLTQINDKTIQQNFNTLKLKYLNSRWGSCSAKKNINISIRLLLAPKEVVDYVLLHELAHLIEMNHSPRFWKIVATHMPNYKTHEQWLKVNGANCDF